MLFRSADLARPLAGRLAMGDDFLQISGEDATIAAFLAQGGHGCISVTANVAPKLCAEMHDAWRAGDLYVTAAKLTNKTDRSQTLDPRTLRGRWLTAAFQHNRLHEAGSEADRTVVYLISDRPFAASLR